MHCLCFSRVFNVDRRAALQGDKKGTRVGVVLDDAEGNNNGTVGGHKYFECASGHGALVLKRKVVEVVMLAADYEKTLKKSPAVKKGSVKDDKKDAEKAAKAEVSRCCIASLADTTRVTTVSCVTAVCHHHSI
jgi:dynactin complex subunit